MKKGKLAESETIPSAYDETKDIDRFWQNDPGDEVLPKRLGFVADCVYCHRGKQISTLYTVWSTLFVLSSAIKREAWLKFGSKKLYTNFYCMLIGPAGIAHKGETMDNAVGLLEGFRDYLDPNDPDFKIRKTINIIEDKGSPEAFLEGMHPGNKRALAGAAGFAKGQGWQRDRR